ncbi:MAG: DNA/RNA non-specific endonuclease [Saprospiraceae bacterium]|nr:DNA/RNA non-specific endonuclease [Saprospiraceae bacterium]
MKKILRVLWGWMKGLFSFSDPETPVNDKDETTDSEGDLEGFDPNFLPVSLELPILADTEAPLLNYRHFSVAVNPARRMPYYTAVNIDAERYNKLKDQIPTRKEIGDDNWVLDKRIPKSIQLPESFYKDNDFDLGHMVRREDVLWGENVEQALAANDDTFYLTNATPQHKDFNRNAERWKGLEDYALKNARKNNLRVSVFSGCVFDEKDRKFKEVQIPGKFWKILIIVKPDGELSATGYIVQQDDLIEDITERGGFSYEQFKTYQVPISRIEAATGLQFQLNDYDPLQKMGIRGSEMQPSAIDDYADIVF